MSSPKIYYHSRNSRVPCICSIRTAKMMYSGVCIGTISEESNDAGECDWVIKPDYNKIDELGLVFDDLDFPFRKSEYILDILPLFIQRRSLSDNTENLYDKLSKVGLFYNDRFEYMILTGGHCDNSEITVESVK